jgi:ABC-type uncharacterized transport system YnjBCD substrate-binding protein
MVAKAINDFAQDKAHTDYRIRNVVSNLNNIARWDSLMTQKHAETKETSGWLPLYPVASDEFPVSIVRGC